MFLFFVFFFLFPPDLGLASLREAGMTDWARAVCGRSWAGLELAGPIHQWGSGTGRQSLPGLRGGRRARKKLPSCRLATSLPSHVPSLCSSMRSLCLSACSTGLPEVLCPECLSGGVVGIALCYGAGPGPECHARLLSVHTPQPLCRPSFCDRAHTRDVCTCPVHCGDFAS